MKASISIVRIWIHLGLIPSADVSLYIWALDYLFFNLLTWGTLLFLGFVFNCVPRCLLFLILYLPLRIYAGGFHAKTKIGCYLISAFTFLFVVLYPADTTIHFYHLVFPCISTCIIYYFSPVSATNKPLDDLEALHYKKMARKILFSEILFFLLILLIFNTQITFAQFVKEPHHQAAQQPSAASKIQKYFPKACKQRRFHAQFASFFRFMAANLSLTHCVTRVRPLMWV